MYVASFFAKHTKPPNSNSVGQYLVYAPASFLDRNRVGLRLAPLSANGKLGRIRM